MTKESIVVLQFLNKNGPSSPRDIEENIENITQKDARIAICFLVNLGFIAVDNHLKLVINNEKLFMIKELLEEEQ